MQFTDKYLKNLKPRAKQFYVREGQGFTVRVLPTGVKTFLYIYVFQGRRRQMNLGIYPNMKLSDARQKYRDAANIHAAGKDPQAIEEVSALPEEKTIKQFVEQYLENWSKVNHSSIWNYNNRKSLENDVLPEWGHRLVSSIRRSDTLALIEKVAKRAPGQARNVVKATRQMLWYAQERGIIDASPFGNKIYKFVPTIRPRSRARTLSDKEITYLWSAIDKGPGDNKTKCALKLILVTAQRPNEVAGMHRREIDGNWWTIPPERIKTEKNKRSDKPLLPHRVYLTSLALSLIGDDKGYIFPSPRENTQIRRNSLSQLVDREYKRTNDGIKVVVKKRYYGLPEWTPNDLRRTARTIMEELGIPERHSEAVLNHALPGIKKVYNRYIYDKEKQKALKKWSDHLEKLIKLPIDPDLLPLLSN